jgi:peptidoglycan hydrolase-like protein with peptidoglycan-binding domain
MKAVFRFVCASVLSIGILLPSVASAAFSEDLSYGAHGAGVVELQNFLKDYGYYSGPITGGFYDMTRAAVIRFQKASGITPAVGYFGLRSRTQANVVRAKTQGTQLAPAASAVESMNSLEATTKRLVAGIETPILFTVHVGVTSSFDKGSVILERPDLANKAVATGTPMRDDGFLGDRVAGDGIYSALIALRPDAPGNIQYRASAKYFNLPNRTYSDAITIVVDSPLTPDQSLQATAQALLDGNLLKAMDGFRGDLAISLGISNLSRANASRMGGCMAQAKLSKDLTAFRSYECDYVDADGKVTPRKEFSISLQDNGRWLVTNW